MKSIKSTGTLSLGSIETDHVTSELCYNEVTFYKHIVKIFNLGAMTWLCYIENYLIMRHVIMSLKCNLDMETNDLCIFCANFPCNLAVYLFLKGF